VADYSAQAVINIVLSQAFPEDPIVGEEDATDLRKPKHLNDDDDDDEAARQAAALSARVVQLADDVLAQPLLADVGERAEWGLGRRWGADALLKAIDRGSHAGGRSGRASRFVFNFFF
jgi:3'(2'), 5'-bisphosphate nucleotidase